MGLARLAKGNPKVTGHQTLPVTIERDLVLGIDGRDRIFAIHDGTERRLDPEVLYTGQILRADRALPVDLNINMQAMMAQQDGLW